MKYCDLHIHSTASDGTFTPEQIVERAYNLGLSGIAITDHDTIAAVAEGRAEAEKRGIEYIPALEISSSELEGRMHILGYFIDIDEPLLTSLLAKLIASREKRVSEICEKMGEIGLNCGIEDIEKISNGATIGRPHLAQYLIDNGVVRDIREAFGRYLAVGRPLYVRKWAPSPREAIDTIHHARGLAVLAHPGATPGAMDMLPYMAQLGIDGVEAYYPRQSHEAQQRAIEYAKEFGLAVTGGSDCHGTRRGDPLLGVFKVRFDLLEKLRDAWREKYV